MFQWLVVRKRQGSPLRVARVIELGLCTTIKHAFANCVMEQAKQNMRRRALACCPGA